MHEAQRRHLEGVATLLHKGAATCMVPVRLQFLDIREYHRRVLPTGIATTLLPEEEEEEEPPEGEGEEDPGSTEGADPADQESDDMSDESERYNLAAAPLSANNTYMSCELG
jgi:hypothetical protein